MRQEILKFQYEEYLTITHMDSNPIDYKVPQTIPTDSWLDDVFDSKRERLGPPPTPKKPLFVADLIYKNNEEKAFECFKNVAIVYFKTFSYILLSFESLEDTAMIYFKVFGTSFSTFLAKILKKMI